MQQLKQYAYILYVSHNQEKRKKGEGLYCLPPYLIVSFINNETVERQGEGKKKNPFFFETIKKCVINNNGSR